MSKAIQFGAVCAMVASTGCEQSKPLNVEVINVSNSGAFRIRVGDAEMHASEAFELARLLQKAANRAMNLNFFGG